MARIGVTGHVDLPVGTAVRIFELLRAALREYGADVHGVTCLARGADQIFARAVLAQRGTFEVVLPARDYREQVIAATNRVDFDALLGRASRVSWMPYEHSGRVAYMAASQELLRRCDRLFAIWDGRPSTRLGDTADVVRAARDLGVPVTVLWPEPEAPESAVPQPAVPDPEVRAG
jgi:hypothetical protein